MASPIERWQREANAGIPPVEYRRAPRFPILQRCLVRVQGAPGSDSWRCIAFNVSTTGLGLTLPCPVRSGTVVDIRPWELPDACRLTARVVHVKQVEFLWFGGCELLRPLTERELQAWMAGPIDWLPEAEAAAL